MCGPIALGIASIGLTLFGGYQQAQAAKAEGAYAAQVANQNAKVATQQADYERQLGNIEEEKQRRNVRLMLGSQRAALAANGIDTTSGTALDLQSETAQLGEEDALAIRANAARRAWGYEVDAMNQKANAAAAKARGKNQAIGSYLGAAAQSAALGYQYVKDYKASKAASGA